MPKPSMITDLRLTVASLRQDLEEAERRIVGLTQNGNEVKALCLALVRKLKRGAAAEAVGRDDVVGQDAWLSENPAPVRISREEWIAATDSPEVKAGKGVVLLVEQDEKTGDVIVNLGDVEQPAPPSPIVEA